MKFAPLMHMFAVLTAIEEHIFEKASSQTSSDFQLAVR